MDIQILCAMGPPSGGRNPITMRFSRHFNICSMNTFSDETMTRIFSTIFSVSLRERNFPSEYFTTGTQIVAATMDMYKSAMNNLLPTPTKSHYVFNLRDFSRVILGTLLVEPQSIENKRTFIRLDIPWNLKIIYCGAVFDKFVPFAFFLPTLTKFVIIPHI